MSSVLGPDALLAPLHETRALEGELQRARRAQREEHRTDI